MNIHPIIDKFQDKQTYELSFVANRFIINHLRGIRQVLQMELDVAFVLGSLAHLNAYSWQEQLMSKIAVSNAKVEPDLRPVRLCDVVESTALPRETVRRHLHQLKRDGKVYQPKSRLWCVLPEMFPADIGTDVRQTIRNLLDTSEEMVGILEKYDRHERLSRLLNERA